MKEKQQRPTERKQSENDSTVMVEERVLNLSKTDAKRNIDQTIRSPDRYLSWYQYNIKKIDKYLTLCPHCKKPTLSAFDKAVIDSAIDYINGKRMFRQYSKNKGDAFAPVIVLFVVGIVIYFLINYI